MNVPGHQMNRVRQHRSLDKLIKSAAKVVRPAKYVTSQMAEVGVPRELLTSILDRTQQFCDALLDPQPRRRFGEIGGFNRDHGQRLGWCHDTRRR